MKSSHYAVNNTLTLNKDNIKVFGIFDRSNNRYIIAEKTYEIQKYYVLQHDPQRSEQGLDDVLQVIQYVCVQVNVGTKQFGRGKRGIEVDTAEFMALRNLVHFYSPNPFTKQVTPRVYDSSGGPQQEKSAPQIVLEDISLNSVNNGPMIYSKDLFL
jgi:hypothetical protein